MKKMKMKMNMMMNMRMNMMMNMRMNMVMNVKMKKMKKKEEEAGIMRKEGEGRKVELNENELPRGCFYGPERCRACKSGLEGSSHTRSGVQYHITCKECSVTNILAEYHGESGDNAVHRLRQHEDAIKRKDNTRRMLWLST